MVTTGGWSVTVAVAVLVLSAELAAVTVTVCAEASDAGAVYKPLVEMLPTEGLIDHVTAVFVDPVTDAVNCCAPPAVRVEVAGLIEIVTGAACKVIVAIAVWVLSAELVAVTVTVCAEVMEAGAVYSPLVEMLPTDGLIDQVAAVFVDPVTVAVNCCVLPACSVAVDGLIEIVTTGCTVTAAVAVFVLSAELVAVTVTVCCEVAEAGAAYSPLLEIVPTAGLTDQLAVVLVEPETVAVNCWLLPAFTVVLVGLQDIVTTGCNVTVAEAFLVVSAALVAVTVTACCEVTEAGAV